MPRTMKNKSKLNKNIGVIDMKEPWNYRPWIRTRELCNGNGRRHVISDLKYPQRSIHLLSDLELSAYYHFRKNPKVMELFEQYPLNLKKTLDISEELDIKHPIIPQTKQYAIMTTDFLLVVNNDDRLEYRACAVKFENELKEKRVLEKLKIEQTYWEQLGVSWFLFTEQSLC